MRILSRCIMIFFVVMLLYVVQRVNVIRLGYEIEDLKKEKKHLDQIHNSLLIERATLTSTERIERIATSYLQMKRPDDTQIVLVKKRDDGNRTSPFAKAEAGEYETPYTFKVVQFSDRRF